MVRVVSCIRTVGSGVAGVAWTAPLLKARGVWSLILHVHVHAIVRVPKIGPNFPHFVQKHFRLLRVPKLSDQWLLHPS